MQIPTSQTGKTKVLSTHIGWKSLIPSNNTSKSHWIIKNLKSEDFLYFVHSYMAVPKDEKSNIAEFDYYGQLIPAIVSNENKIGCHFYPEKSERICLKILKN